MSINLTYEKYPISTIIFSNLITFFTYLTGFIILFKAWNVSVIVYILYIAFIEIRLLKNSCTSCYYYDKVCAFGRGKICSLIFKKQNPQIFKCKKITWKEIIPEMLISIIPLFTGIIFLIIDFQWLILALLIILFLLTSYGNAYVRGQMACNHCKQADIGCPALEFFKKPTNNSETP
ncbi:hypothetical protein ACFLU5_02240 [Bacteroidota bacterium]